jgi:PAS domain S-box-containing protein
VDEVNLSHCGLGVWPDGRRRVTEETVMVHRKSEAGLETVKFFESLLRTSADGIVVTGMMQNIIFANEAFCDLFGLSKREIMETSLLALLEQAGVDAAKRWAEAEQLVHSRGLSRDMEIRLTRGNKVGCYSVNASRLEKSAGDDGVFILSLWRDVSRSKEAEEALRKYREDLELRVQERTAELELERNKLKFEKDKQFTGSSNGLPARNKWKVYSFFLQKNETIVKMCSIFLLTRKQSRWQDQAGNDYLDVESRYLHVFRDVPDLPYRVFKIGPLLRVFPFDAVGIFTRFAKLFSMTYNVYIIFTLIHERRILWRDQERERI